MTHKNNSDIWLSLDLLANTLGREGGEIQVFWLAGEGVGKTCAFGYGYIILYRRDYQYLNDNRNGFPEIFSIILLIFS